MSVTRDVTRDGCEGGGKPGEEGEFESCRTAEPRSLGKRECSLCRVGFGGQGSRGLRARSQKGKLPRPIGFSIFGSREIHGAEGRLVREGMLGWGSVWSHIQVSAADGCRLCVCVCVCVSNSLGVQGVSTLSAGLCRASMLVSLCVGI